MSRNRQPLPEGTWSGRRALLLTRECLATYGRTCHLCGTPGATTADHVIPRAKGGPNTLANLRPAHHGCNASRGDRTMEEWWAAKPHLRERVAQLRPLLAPSRRWTQ